MKLIIKLDIKGKDELEKILGTVSQDHNIDVSTNVSEIINDVENVQGSFSSFFENIQVGFAKFGLMVSGIREAFSLLQRSVGDYINHAREQIRAERLVEGAIRATGSAAGFTAEQLKSMASELQNISNFGDEEILAGVTNILLTFREVQGDIFEEAQKLALDMSEALGQNLKTSAMQLGRALQDPLRGMTALRRAGVQLTANQEEQIKNFMEINDLASAQRVILNELANQFGGQAENLVDPIIQLKNAFGDLKEDIGFLVLPAINSVANTLQGLVGSFRNVITTFRSGAREISSITTHLGKTTAETTRTRAEFSQLSQELLRLAQVSEMNSYEKERYSKLIQTLNTDYRKYLPNLISESDVYFSIAENLRVAEHNLQEYFERRKKVAIATDIQEEIASLEARNDKLETFIRAHEAGELVVARHIDGTLRSWVNVREEIEGNKRVINELQARYKTAMNVIDSNKEKTLSVSMKVGDFDNVSDREIEEAFKKFVEQGIDFAKEPIEIAQQLNIEYQSNVEVINRLIEKWKELSKAKETDSTINIIDQEYLESQLESFSSSLQKKTMLLEENYRNNKDILRRTVRDEEEKHKLLKLLEKDFISNREKLSSIDTQVTDLNAYKQVIQEKQKILEEIKTQSMENIIVNISDKEKELQAIKAIESEYAKESARLKQLELETEIVIARERRDTGISGFKELKEAAQNYYYWIKSTYAEDSYEYIRAKQTKESISEETRIERELSSIRQSLKTREEILTENYQREKNLIEQTILDNKEKNRMLIELETKFKSDINSIQDRNFQEEISFAEQKKQLGILNYTELKTIVDNYYQWTSDNYDKDSREYIRVLNMKTQTHQSHLDEVKANQEKQIQEIHDILDRQVFQFETGKISLPDLEYSFKINKQAIIELGLETEYSEFLLAQLDERFKNIAKDNSFERRLNQQLQELRDHSIAARIAIDSIESSFSNVLSQLIIEGRSFSRIMQNVWKNLATNIINEINRILVRMLLIRGFSLILGGGVSWGNALTYAVGIGKKDGGIVGTVPGYAGGGAPAGLFRGAGGPRDDANIIRISNGEYIINAEKTTMLKPLLDFLNFAPKTYVKNFLNSIQLPNISIPTMPKIAYASGGATTSGYSLSGLEDRMDRMIDRLERLEKKEYNVNVKTKFKGVEFAREINKAQDEYTRTIR